MSLLGCVQACLSCLLPSDQSSAAKEREREQNADNEPYRPPVQQAAGNESAFADDPYGRKHQPPLNAPQSNFSQSEDSDFPPLSGQAGHPSGGSSQGFHGSYAQAAGHGVSHEQANQQAEHRKPYYQVPQQQHQQYQKPYQEQNYGPDVGSRVQVNPTERELEDYTVACNRLWELDSNRLTPGREYELSLQSGKKVYGREDAASANLFDFVDHDSLSKPTFARLYALLDNYQAVQRAQEDESQQEQQEQRAFIEEIYRTAPIRYLHEYLVKRNFASRDADEFKRQLSQLWFRLYNRGGAQRSSSAFEHVFVGEVKDGQEGREVSGFHNWIHFYVEEAKGALDYQGFILPRRRSTDLPDSQTQLVTVQFTWHGVRKQASSIFIGTSPEFELALYTLCFYAGQEDNRLQIGPYYVNVKCYRMGRDRIGSVFTTVDE